LIISPKKNFGSQYNNVPDFWHQYDGARFQQDENTDYIGFIIYDVE